jgi:hypothetical protein
MMRTSAIGTAALALALAAPGLAGAQTAKDLVGTWKMVKNTVTSADGKTMDVFGGNGTGMASFTPDGRFVIVNINPDTPKFAAKARDKGTADENKAAVAGGIGLYGTYKVMNKEIVMHVDGSTYPNWSGTEQKRDVVKFTPDEFTWSLASSLGGTAQVSWRRIK